MLIEPLQHVRGCHLKFSGPLFIVSRLELETILIYKLLCFSTYVYEKDFKTSWEEYCFKYTGRFSLVCKLAYLAIKSRMWNNRDFSNQDAKLIQIQSNI
ncbi:hypothetical protein NC652_038178 [Populus alba x Populus x berolinensis]|nr:hypothetical protein NC652_038178 [Populus alba x Populus x berolinensis]